MMNSSSAIVFLSGAGGGAPDFEIFRAGPNDATRFEVIGYPGWRSYVAEGFSAETLIEELVAGITKKVPRGQLRIVGLSIGAHFGYVAALRLQAMGREIAGFCAIDSFRIASSGPTAGWKGRALVEGWELLSNFRFFEFARFLRSRFWRALNRVAGDRLPWILRSSARWLPSALSLDPIFEQELNMRLLIRKTASWIESLDRNTVPLESPAIFLRTSLTAKEDDVWQRRCPKVKIFEIPGRHHSLFDSENVDALHKVFIDATRDWRERL
jgi:thioesterase domain-containing protein